MTSKTEVAANVRAILETSCKAFNKLAIEQAKLNDKRTGSYTGTINAAIEAGDMVTFKAAYEGLKSDITGNVAGTARKLGCKLGKANKEGKANYVVPSGLMSAVSVVLGCMEAKISLTDDDGEARSFTELREAKAELAAKEKEATETPIQTAQRIVRELAAELAAGADALTVTQAQECAKILRNLIGTESGAKTGTNG